MKKNQRVRLYGNDDRRPVRAHVDELHPLSRIRATILFDRKTKLRCNVSRDVLRSIVASQRHNRLLPTGKATTDELLSELERDCVTIVRRPIEGSHPMARLCRELADALVEWPRMRMSMSNMATPFDYSVGPTHAIVRIGKKARFEADVARNRPCKELVRAFCVRHESKAFGEVKAFFSRDELRRWLREQPTFWYHMCDNGSPSPRELHAAVCGDARFLDLLMAELGRYWRTCPELDSVFECFDEDRHSPAVDMLFDAINALGWTVTRCPAGRGPSRYPLVFPTACVTTDRRDGGRSVDMLLEPPFC